MPREPELCVVCRDMETRVIVNINFKPVHVCENCCRAITLQQIRAWAEESTAPVQEASPSWISCAAETIAWRPLPQSRLTVNAGVSTGRPPLTATTRDIYMSFG